MKTHTLTKTLSCLALFCLVISTVAWAAGDGENLVPNGTFDSDIKGVWKGVLEVEKTDDSADVPEITFVEDDGVGDSKGCMKVALRKFDGKDVAPWTAGARVILKDTIPENTPAKVTFSAKSLDGSWKLLVIRPGGGSKGEAVELSQEWQQFEVTFFSELYGTPVLMFTLIPPTGPASHVENGEFLLDDVSVTVESK